MRPPCADGTDCLVQSVDKGMLPEKPEEDEVKVNFVIDCFTNRTAAETDAGCSVLQPKTLTEATALDPGH